MIVVIPSRAEGEGSREASMRDREVPESEPDWRYMRTLARTAHCFAGRGSVTSVRSRNYLGGNARITQALIPPKPNELLIT